MEAIYTVPILAQKIMEEGDLLILFAGLSTTILVLVVGAIMAYKTPEMNGTFGYRTKQAMASEAKWDFAQKYSGKGLILGMVFLLLVRGIAFLTGNWDTMVEIYLNLAVALVCVPVLILTESKLKKM